VYPQLHRKELYQGESYLENVMYQGINYSGKTLYSGVTNETHCMRECFTYTHTHTHTHTHVLRK